MKYLFLLLIVPLLSNSDCKHKKDKVSAQEVVDSVVVKDPVPVTTSIPACVLDLIEKAKKDIPPTTPQKVEEYLFNGKKVYLVTPPCCDYFNTVYDDSCKVICSPTGGITGKGDGKCPEFLKTATLVKTVWPVTEK